MRHLLISLVLCALISTILSVTCKTGTNELLANRDGCVCCERRTTKSLFLTRIHFECESSVERCHQAIVIQNKPCLKMAGGYSGTVFERCLSWKNDL